MGRFWGEAFMERSISINNFLFGNTRFWQGFQAKID
jgi:hypothetical protein